MDMEKKEISDVELAVRIAVNYIALNIDAADTEKNREVLKKARELGNAAKLLNPPPNKK